MSRNIELVTLDDMDYVIDFKNGQFINMLLPENVVSFESEQGRNWCEMLSIEKCADFHRYVRMYDGICMRCEHMLLCE